MMRLVARIIVLTLVTFGFLPLANADDGVGCELGIADECTRIIDTRQLFGKPIGDENLAVTYFNRGNARLRKGNFDSAIGDYTEAIKLKPKYSKAYANRGAAWYNKGRHDNAIDDYSNAITLNPKDPFSFNNRGKAFLAVGKFQRAILDFKKASHISPTNAQIQHGLGEAYLASSDTSSAMTAWRNSCDLAQTKILIGWQETLIRLGHYDGEPSGHL